MIKSILKQTTLKKIKQGIAASLAGLFFFTNVAGLHATESNFWAERRRAAQESQGSENGSSPIQLASAGDFASQIPQANPVSFGGVAPAVGGGLVANASLSVSPLSRPAGFTHDQDWLVQAVAPFGTIQDAHFASAKSPLIVHIQDAHGILDAQRNTASIILGLQKARGIQLVGLEGASGGFRTEAFRSLNDLPTTRLVAADLFALGMLGGAEYAGMVAEKAPLLWGVENLSDYHANIEAYKQAAKNAPAFKTKVEGLAKVVDALKPTLYSPALLEFDRIHTAYQKNGDGLGAYVTYLLNTPLGSKANVPQLLHLKEALMAESTIDFKVVDSERRHLVESLAKNMSKSNLEALVHQSVLFRGGRLNHTAFHRALVASARAHGIRMESFPQFNAYVRYVESAERIRLSDLFNELLGLEARVQTDLAQGEKEKQLLASSRAVLLLERLAAQAMSPTDWAEYGTRRASVLTLAATLRDLAKGTNVPVVADWPAMETALQPFEDFCRYASTRNQGLTDNLLEKMKAEKSAGAVLVAGGFHTEGLVEQFKAKDLSYVVVTPKIKEVPKENRYLEAFTRDPRPLEKILSGERIFLVTPLSTAESSAPGIQDQTVKLAVIDTAVRVMADSPTNGPEVLAEVEEMVKALFPDIPGGIQFTPGPGENTVRVFSSDDQGKKIEYSATYAPADSFEGTVLVPLRAAGTLADDAQGRPKNYSVLSLEPNDSTREPMSLVLYQVPGSQGHRFFGDTFGRLISATRDFFKRSSTILSSPEISPHRQGGYVLQVSFVFGVVALSSVAAFFISGPNPVFVATAFLGLAGFIVLTFFPQVIVRFASRFRSPDSPWVNREALDTYFQKQLLALLNSRRDDLEPLLTSRARLGRKNPIKFKEINDQIQKIVDEINALPAMQGEWRSGSEGDELSSAYTDFLASSDYERYRSEVVSLLLAGKIGYQLFFAGAATRLGLGPMMLVDLVEVAEAVLNIPDQKIGQVERAKISKKWHDHCLEVATKALSEEAKIEGQDFKLYVVPRLSQRIKQIDEELRAKLQETYDKIPGNPGNKATRGIAERHLMAKRFQLERLAIENRIHPDTVIARQPLVIHVNDAIWDQVKEDLVRHDFYGFNPRNIVFVFSPFKHSHDYIDGALRVNEGSEQLPVGGHLSATASLFQPGEGYILSADGKKTKRLRGTVESFLRRRGVDELLAHRINDSTMFTPESLDINRLAFCLHMVRGMGHGLVAELVANPKKTKGGNLVQNLASGFRMLIETMNTQGSPQLTKLLDEMSRKASPYNAFRLFYSLKRAEEVFRKGNFRINLRWVPASGTFTVEMPAGDLTQQKDLNSAFYQRAPNETIDDFKTFGDLNAALLRLSIQENTPGFSQSADRAVLPSPKWGLNGNGYNRWIWLTAGFLAGILLAAMAHDFATFLNSDSWIFPNFKDLIFGAIGILDFQGIGDGVGEQLLPGGVVLGLVGSLGTASAKNTLASAVRPAPIKEQAAIPERTSSRRWLSVGLLVVGLALFLIPLPVLAAGFDSAQILTFFNPVGHIPNFLSWMGDASALAALPTIPDVLGALQSGHLTTVFGTLAGSVAALGMAGTLTVRSFYYNPAPFEDLLKSLSNPSTEKGRQAIEAVAAALLESQGPLELNKKWHLLIGKMLVAEEGDRWVIDSLNEVTRRVAGENARRYLNSPDPGLMEQARRSLYTMGYIERLPLHFRGLPSPTALAEETPVFAPQAQERLREMHRQALLAMEAALALSPESSPTDASRMAELRQVLADKHLLNGYIVHRAKMDSDRFQSISRDGLDVSKIRAGDEMRSQGGEQRLFFWDWARLSDVSDEYFNPRSPTVLLRIQKTAPTVKESRVRNLSEEFGDQVRDFEATKIPAEQIELVDPREPWKSYPIHQFRNIEDFMVFIGATQTGGTADLSQGPKGAAGLVVNLSDDAEREALTRSLVDNLGAVAEVSTQIEEISPAVWVGPSLDGTVRVSGKPVPDFATELDRQKTLSILTPPSHYRSEQPAYASDFANAMVGVRELMTERLTQLGGTDAPVEKLMEALGYTLGVFARSGLNRQDLTRLYMSVVNEIRRGRKMGVLEHAAPVFSAALAVGKRAEIYSSAQMNWLTHVASNPEAEVSPVLHVTEENRGQLGDVAVRVARGLGVKQQTSTLLLMSDNAQDVTDVKKALFTAGIVGVSVKPVALSGEAGVLDPQGDLLVFQEAKFFSQLAAEGIQNVPQRVAGGNLVFPIISEATNLDLSQVTNRTAFLLARLMGSIVMIIGNDIDDDMKSLRKALEAA